MTEEERNIARIYEDQMLSERKIRVCDMYDDELREFGSFNAFEESEKVKTKAILHKRLNFYSSQIFKERDKFVSYN